MIDRARISPIMNITAPGRQSTDLFIPENLKEGMLWNATCHTKPKNSHFFAMLIGGGYLLKHSSLPRAMAAIGRP